MRDARNTVTSSRTTVGGMLGRGACGSRRERYRREDTPAPNPFHRNARISFSLARPGHASLRVFDLHGREVCRLLDDTRPAGPLSVTWDGRDARGKGLPAGVFFLRLDADGSTRGRRIVKLD